MADVKQMRPLRRVGSQMGVWASRDGRWVFKKHWGDPAPQRWFAYAGDSEWPSNEGEGHTTLRDAVEWCESDWGEQMYREATDTTPPTPDPPRGPIQP